MPTPASMKLPLVNDPMEFEKMCKDVLQYKLNVTIELYGHSGEKQNGIDLRSTNSPIKYAAQCKNYSEKNIEKFKIQIKKDIDMANENHDIDIFYIMTSLQRNSKIQDFIKILADKTKFEIQIMFWDDIEEVICNRNDLMAAYYPTLISQDNKITLAQLNEIIESATELKNCAKNIYETSSLYSAGRSQETDTEIYRIARYMHIHSELLYNYFKKWNIELTNMKVASHIDWISENMPTFYIDCGFGDGMVLTVVEFLAYFRNDSQGNFDNFTKHCKKIVKNINKYEAARKKSVNNILL